MKNKVFYICGSSASGKTEFSIELAKHIQNAVFINADTMQLYKGLEPLAAHPTASEMSRIDTRLFSVFDIGKNISRSEWLEIAKKEIEQAFSDGKQPILIGGSRSFAATLAQAAYGIKLNVNQKKEPTFPEDANKKLDFPYPLYSIVLTPSGKNIEKRVLKRLKENSSASLEAVHNMRCNGYSELMPGASTIGVKEYSDVLDNKISLPLAEKEIIKRGISYINEQKILFTELSHKAKINNPLNSLVITSPSLDDKVSQALKYIEKIKASDRVTENKRIGSITI